MAGAQEQPWPGCYALAAENYSFGQESQPNGLILLIQPKGLHTAALSFTAREEDSLKEGEEKERRSGEQLGAFELDRPQSPEGLFSCIKKTKKKGLFSLILDIKLNLRLCLDCGQSHLIPQSCFL